MSYISEKEYLEFLKILCQKLESNSKEEVIEMLKKCINSKKSEIFDILKQYK